MYQKKISSFAPIQKVVEHYTFSGLSIYYLTYSVKKTTWYSLAQVMGWWPFSVGEKVGFETKGWHKRSLPGWSAYSFFGQTC